MLYAMVGSGVRILEDGHSRNYSGLMKIVLVLSILLHNFQTQGQGILFNSNDSLLLKRTAYQVFHKNIPSFQDRFTIRFDLSIWDKKHLGYVLNVKDEQNRLFSLSYLFSGKETGYLNLNIGNESNKLKIPLNTQQLQQRSWMILRLEFRLTEDSMYVWLNDKRYAAGGFGFRKSMKPGIYFGKFEYLNDVPSMAIRDLHVTGNGKDFHFPLNEWEGETVSTADGKQLGHVDYPNWLINESYFWKERATRKFHEVAGVCFVPDSGQLLLYGKESMDVYDMARNSTKTVAYKNPLPVNMILGKSVFIPEQHRCYVYEANNVKPGEPTMAALDLSTLTWEVVGKAFVPEQRHHHNVFYDSSGQHIYLFGGYGSFSWFNTFFRYARNEDNWERIYFTGDTITPRFFSAAGDAGKPGELFIFGGFGNASGEQIVGGKHTYDLYHVNLRTRTIKKYWDRKITDSNFVPANNLMLSADKKHFYVICYPHHISRTLLQLYKFSVEDGSYEIVSSRIPVISEKIESDINLYLNKSTEELYCVIQEFSDARNSVVKLYSLAYPPVPPLPKADRPQPYGKAWLLAPVLLVAGAAVFFWRKKRRKQLLASGANEVEEEVPGILKPDGEEAPPPSIRQNAIYILGPLTVYDKKGTDITHLFSPKIRLLFVLILLKTQKGGITSREISLALWPEKEVTKTKNIRGVNINHLRNVLADLEGIKLVFVNDSYTFEMNERIFCDYLDVMKEVKSLSGNALAHLFMRGNLLTDHEDERIDPFRQAYEEEVLPVILGQLRELYLQNDYKTAYKLTGAILGMDPFHETAIQYQLAILRRWKGGEAARKKYELFATNYERSLGIAYQIPFEKIPLPETDPPPH